MLFILHDIPNRQNLVTIEGRHELKSIVKITAKKNNPNVITFKFGFADGNDIQVVKIQRFWIDKAEKATKFITDSIVKLISEEENSQVETHDTQTEVFKL